jgi:hypothetical protein
MCGMMMRKVKLYKISYQSNLKLRLNKAGNASTTLDTWEPNVGSLLHSVNLVKVADGVQCFAEYVKWNTTQSN